MAGTIRQRLRRYNGTDYDSIYLSANVGDVVGTLSTTNGGTGNSSVDTTPTANSTKMCTSGGIYTELQTLKTSVSNGKSAIASAITDKGISTSSSASFSTMASNIQNIQTIADTTGTATPSVIVKGYTAWVNGVKIVGTMPLSKTVALTGSGSARCSSGFTDVLSLSLGDDYSSIAANGTYNCYGGSGSTSTITISSVTLARGTGSTSQGLPNQGWWNTRIYFSGTSVSIQLQYTFGGTGSGHVTSSNLTIICYP